VKPRVILLSTFLTPFRSGAEACAEEIALRLCDRFDITIVTARLQKDAPKRETLQGKVPVLRIGFGSPVDKWLYPFLAPCTCRGIARYSAGGGPLLLHAILETFAGLALVFCRVLLPSGKRILTLQTLNRSFLKGPIIRSAEHVTAISEALRKIAKKKGKEALLIPNGLDLSLVPNIPKVPGRLLFVGRLEKMKRVDLLLKIFKEIRAELPSGVHLRIVGDGSEREHLQVLATTLGLTDRVTFVGKLSPEGVYKEYAEAEIFCSLPKTEALGNVFLEAQACGCAILATRTGGIPDIVKDGVTGLLTDIHDFSGQLKGLRRLIKDDAFRKTLAEAGRMHAKNYDWSSIAMAYRKLYESVAQS